MTNKFPSIVDILETIYELYEKGPPVSIISLYPNEVGDALRAEGFTITNELAWERLCEYNKTVRQVKTTPDGGEVVEVWLCEPNISKKQADKADTMPFMFRMGAVANAIAALRPQPALGPVSDSSDSPANLAETATPQQPSATIFYSWQSDLPNSANRGFIENCLERAIKELKADPALQVDPCLDRDTQNVPGSPDIAATIFDKIDKCSLFVCDVSIVNQSASDRPMPNPNVLIELGYAIKTLGWSRIVCVFNQATGRIQDLPFDLRQRRVRSYELREGEDKTEPRKLATSLLKTDLQQVFNSILPQHVGVDAVESGEEGSHSIRFSVDDWTVWQEPAYDPDDAVVVINQWRAGDIRYSCTIRLRNDLGWDDELHRLRMEFRQGDRVLLADTYAFTDDGVVLPSKKWVSLAVCYGVHEEGVFAASDAVWFVAETVGDNSKVAWLVASLNHTIGK